jgi:hypothetical protein
VAAAALVNAQAARDAEKRLELIAELMRLALLAGLAVAFANFGQMELASASLGGALALLKPRGAPGPNLSALTLGLAVGAGTYLVQSNGLI